MLEVLQQTSDLWVLNKPANVSLLRDRQGAPDLWRQINADLGKGYLVHRLDKGTSGVLLVARNQARQRTLTRALAAHQVRKFYLAWVVGEFHAGATVGIDLPLCKGRKSRYRVAGQRNQIRLHKGCYSVTPDRAGVDATTRARCLHSNGSHSLLMLQPKHGRTHQLRVHLSWLGSPIVGDPLYGAPGDPAQSHSRLQLHCRSLCVQGRIYRAPLPRDFETWHAVSTHNEDAP